MYSNKENVNILTALLVKWGIEDAVVCPGSRNAPLVHNLNECPDIDCYPVTDERSAGFFALGLSQIDDEPIVVCVTSGSALLNVAPAVAEAFYQHRKLIIISADRPAAIIDQLQGQTIHQPNALAGFVRKAVSLPEPHNDTERWHCNRLVNEALMEMFRGEGGPVHINIPISEPLFEFSIPTLPDERIIRPHFAKIPFYNLAEISEDFRKAKRPMILIGQVKTVQFEGADEQLEDLENYAPVLCEKLGYDYFCPPTQIDKMLLMIEEEEEEYLPDFIIYYGGHFVSKRIKDFLRKARGARCIIVNADATLHDVFMNATDVLESSLIELLSALAMAILKKSPTAFRNKWSLLKQKATMLCDSYEPPFSQMSAVRQLCSTTADTECVLHFGNSMAIRLGLIYAQQYVFANRGVNGIEGSLSTAVGFACGIEEHVYCVIGDLSFFYDQNALWNNNLTGNLRILLLNNGGGGIFDHLPGLADSPASQVYIAAAHQATAQGICEENNVAYHAAHNEQELAEGIEALTAPGGLSPVLLEVFTDREEDRRVLRDFLYGDKKKLN